MSAACGLVQPAAFVERIWQDRLDAGQRLEEADELGRVERPEQVGDEGALDHFELVARLQARLGIVEARRVAIGKLLHHAPERFHRKEVVEHDVREGVCAAVLRRQTPPGLGGLLAIEPDAIAGHRWIENRHRLLSRSTREPQSPRRLSTVSSRSLEGVTADARKCQKVPVRSAHTACRRAHRKAARQSDALRAVPASKAHEGERLGENRTARDRCAKAARTES